VGDEGLNYTSDRIPHTPDVAHEVDRTLHVPQPFEALSRLDTPTMVVAQLPSSLGLHEGALLHDRMGGPDVSVSGGAISVTLGAQGVAILAP
jgi:hypothetical protein